MKDSITTPITMRILSFTLGSDRKMLHTIVAKTRQKAKFNRQFWYVSWSVARLGGVIESASHS